MPATLRSKEKFYPRRSDHVVWKIIEEKGVLLNLENGAYFEVNPVGLAMWKKCDGKTESNNLAASIAREFGIDTGRVNRDLFTFITELKRKKLLEVSGEPKAAATQA